MYFHVHPPAGGTGKALFVVRCEAGGEGGGLIFDELLDDKSTFGRCHQRNTTEQGQFHELVMIMQLLIVAAPP